MNPIDWLMLPMKKKNIWLVYKIFILMKNCEQYSLNYNKLTYQNHVFIYTHGVLHWGNNYQHFQNVITAGKKVPFHKKKYSL